MRSVLFWEQHYWVHWCNHTKPNHSTSTLVNQQNNGHGTKQIDTSRGTQQNWIYMEHHLHPNTINPQWQCMAKNVQSTIWLQHLSWTLSCTLHFFIRAMGRTSKIPLPTKSQWQAQIITHIRTYQPTKQTKLCMEYAVRAIMAGTYIRFKPIQKAAWSLYGTA